MTPDKSFMFKWQEINSQVCLYKYKRDIRNIIFKCQIRMSFKEAPTNAWTSLIGSSPGHMLSGRQSHVSLKSKEAWFYEHLPVLTFATNLLMKNLLLNTNSVFHRIINRCYSFGVFLELHMFGIYWLAVCFPIRTYWYSRLYFRTSEHMFSGSYVS